MNIITKFNVSFSASKYASQFLQKHRNQLSACLFLKSQRNFNTYGFKAQIANSETISDASSEDADRISDAIISKVNKQIKEKSHSRLFAVIKLCEKKFKIAAEDIIAIGSYFPAQVGERICLEKVLAIGSRDFTLLGRPLLSKDLVRIEATIIEKTHIIPRPIYRQGLHYRRLHWFRTPYVLIRINSIEFSNSLDTLPTEENVQNRVIY